MPLAVMGSHCVQLAPPRLNALKETRRDVRHVRSQHLEEEEIRVVVEAAEELLCAGCPVTVALALP